MIQLFLTDNGKNVYRRPSIRKISFWSSNSLGKLLSKGHKISFRVVYKPGWENSIEVHCKEDLTWGLTAFVKEYIKDFV